MVEYDSIEEDIRPLLHALESDPVAGLESAAAELERRRYGKAGVELPLFKYRPLCPPWNKEGGLYYQALVPKCKSRIMIVTTCNRGGKTTGLLVPYVIGRARGQHPLLSDCRWDVPQNIWVGAHPKLVNGLFKLIVAMLPETDRQQCKIYYSKGDERIEWPAGSVIRMKSYGMDRTEWQMEEVNLIAFDEEPPDHVWEESMMRLNAPDSQCLITATMVESSPFLFEVAEGFQEDTKNRLDGYFSWFSAGMDDNPTLPKDFVEHAKHVLRKDPDMYRIRILGIPTELQGKRLFREVLGNVKKYVKPPVAHYWFDDRGRPKKTQPDSLLRLDVFDMPVPHLRYVIGADIAEGGLDGDWTTAHIICADNGKVVAKFKGKIEPGPFGKFLAWMGYWYNTATLNWELNMQGGAVTDRLNMMRYRNLCPQESFAGRRERVLNAVGFRTTGPSKHAIVGDLRDAIGDDVLQVPDAETYDELQTFGYLKRDSGFARFKGLGVLPPGKHDDLVMSLAIAWYTTRFAQAPKRGKNTELSWGEELYQWTMKQEGRKNREDIIGGYLR